MTMKKISNLFLIVFIMTMLHFSCKNSQQQSAKTGLNPSNMDTTIRPGNNFFEYANGGWMKSHPIPAEKTSYSSFDELDDANRLALKTIIDEVSKNTVAKNGTIEQKIRDFYNSGMDSVKLEKEGLTPLKSEFDMIDKITNKDELQNLIAHFQQYGINTFFYIFAEPDAKNSSVMLTEIYQSGLGLPDRDYYTNQDDRSKEIRKEYQIFLSKLFELMGDSKDKAVKNADVVFKIEMQLAKASNTHLQNRDPQKTYNKFTIEALGKLTPNFNWTNFIKNIGYSNIAEFNINQPEYIKEVDKMIKSVSIEDWKTFLRRRLINATSSYLSSSFDKLDFEFYNKFLSGQQEQRPRWKRVLDNTSDALGEAIGQMYVKKYFPPEAKQRMLELVGNLKKSLKLSLENLTWMSTETKKEAISKLDKIVTKIGYPDNWRDYSGLQTDTVSYVLNVLQSNRFEFQYSLNKIGKPVDHSVWGMTPQTINAYYNPNLNEIVFPAAILQPPFFDINADDAVNYGAIGMVIGHEMTHGFDDQGRQFDKEGNLRDWWQPADSKKFEEQTKFLVNQYNSFFVKDTFHVNGALTLGENIADFGGLTVAFNAFAMTEQAKDQSKAIDGFTPNQRFFLGYAQVWRTNMREKALLRRVQEDEHSPARYRVNGALFNLPEFYKAFPQIAVGDSLFVKPENRPLIW